MDHGNWLQHIPTTPSGPRVARTIARFNTSTTRWTINQRGLGHTFEGQDNDNTGQSIPLSSGHTGGCNVFGDGVKFLSNAVDLVTLQQLSAAAMDLLITGAY